jgi:hypothetical protein
VRCVDGPSEYALADQVGSELVDLRALPRDGASLRGQHLPYPAVVTTITFADADALS